MSRDNDVREYVATLRMLRLRTALPRRHIVIRHLVVCLIFKKSGLLQMAHILLDKFEKATSHNLPHVDIVMMAIFIKKDRNFISPEIKNVKAIRNGRESYGESAVGYVQVKKTGNIYTLLCGVTPEHKVTSQSYKVEVVVDIGKGEIRSAKCFGCVASLGGCKHSLAFLGWIHRRSEEPTPTEVACYWKKSKLSRVGSTEKFIKASELGFNQQNKNKKRKRKETPQDSFLKEVVEHISTKKQKLEPHQSIPMIDQHFSQEEEDIYDVCDLHCLGVKFQKLYPVGTVKDFISTAKRK